MLDAQIIKLVRCVLCFSSHNKINAGLACYGAADAAIDTKVKMSRDCKLK